MQHSKTCSNCKEQREATQFHQSHTSKDGLQNICKRCKTLQREAARDFFAGLPYPGSIRDRAVQYGVRDDKTKVSFAKSVKETDSGCIEWTGAIDGSGYGQFFVAAPGTGASYPVKAHRFAWALAGNELPEGIHGHKPDSLVLNHRCHNRACVNPAHLEVITHAENVSSAKRKPTVSAAEFAQMREILELAKTTLAEARGEAA